VQVIKSIPSINFPSGVFAGRVILPEILAPTEGFNLILV
jgi:hypothetical protein